MPSLDDVRAITVTLPASEERATTSGAAWFVRGKLFAWEAYPWPSVAPDIQAIILREPVFAVKVPEEDHKRAYLQGWPGVFLAQAAGWSEPKIAFRLAAIEPELLREVITEAWYCQAPRYLKRAFDEGRAT